MKSWLLASALVVSLPAAAEWVVTEDSSIHYVSIKNNSIAENNAFSGVTGSVSDSGQIAITIDLASVETGVGIRNERMQSMFFEVASFPNATVTGQLSDDMLSELADGAVVEQVLPLTLSLHGVEASVTAHLRAAPAEGGWHIATLQPILIKAEDFALTDGVEALRTIAGLQAISAAVPVTVDLHLTER